MTICTETSSFLSTMLFVKQCCTWWLHRLTSMSHTHEIHVESLQKRLRFKFLLLLFCDKTRKYCKAFKWYMILIQRFKWDLKNERRFALPHVSLFVQPLGFSATQQHINRKTSWSLFVFDYTVKWIFGSQTTQQQFHSNLTLIPLIFTVKSNAGANKLRRSKLM